MTGSAGSGSDELPADDSDQGHRVRRRRRAANRPAGPPTARTDSTGSAAVPSLDPAAAPDPAAEEASAVAPPEPTAAGADPTTAGAPAAGALDPVEKSDRRREKKRRNRAERLAAEAAAKPVAAPAPTEPANRGRRPSGERGLHGLEGNRSTQLPSTEAMRAREWAAPGPEDLAAAEAELVIVRRHYRPPEPLPTKTRPTPHQEGRAGSRAAADRRTPRD